MSSCFTQCSRRWGTVSLVWQMSQTSGSSFLNRSLCVALEQSILSLFTTICSFLLPWVNQWLVLAFIYLFIQPYDLILFIRSYGQIRASSRRFNQVASYTAASTFSLPWIPMCIGIHTEMILLLFLLWSSVTFSVYKNKNTQVF